MRVASCTHSRMMTGIILAAPSVVYDLSGSPLSRTAYRASCIVTVSRVSVAHSVPSNVSCVPHVMSRVTCQSISPVTCHIICLLTVLHTGMNIVARTHTHTHFMHIRIKHIQYIATQHHSLSTCVYIYIYIIHTLKAIRHRIM